MIKYHRSKTALYDDLEDLFEEEAEENEEDDTCPQYGEGWEKNCDDCIRCPEEVRCRKQTLRNRRQVRPARRPRKRDVEERSIVRYEERELLDERMPRKDEHWAERLTKNVFAGSLSAAGEEVMLYFKKFRW